MQKISCAFLHCNIHLFFLFLKYIDWRYPLILHIVPNKRRPTAKCFTHHENNGIYLPIQIITSEEGYAQFLSFEWYHVLNHLLFKKKRSKVKVLLQFCISFIQKKRKMLVVLKRCIKVKLKCSRTYANK